MKIIFGVMALLAVIYFMSAFTQQTDSINGSTRVTAFKSAKKIKRYMTSEQQHLFETAFWTLQEIKSREPAGEGRDPFLTAVDGKTADEIIELAQQEVATRIQAGDPEFSKYGSWDNMVKSLTDSDKKKKPNTEPASPLRDSVRTGRPDPAAAPEYGR